ncbi:hypothetical protein PHYBLDRAFT_142919 [Phycomyces blakesleeanus NRRL 1555(-)]|uniref:Armadillo repeat-containing protein 7 n=1 Tax=Phycomyces blakesleeanus (strain ATCC 8743b / DSM 1359 / FGSC 10004 / NBRC 33097 / NRRL 1555) TaxID=763407 RepID=A0A162XP46_PHYB8|nr:hypothetical protein PHYBLDRAFT_142919 [Phycomyces blakesleeanus NRRL 1555(-)]OAD75935.1 hypothetical protein PHYBLDRAFT_142919 [Phycomyces blakesleeanus NRRL 1555(-)]|eukprot:XP_018293975.1 hypothetical protein PHYBLDRAFT_142919 [Phycomyces blakesleeanus NRRL 1555(-)]
MFQSKEYILRHRGKKGPDREEYLRQLVQEYSVTDNLESKQQILANLGNFAYDPVNFVWLWNLKVVDLFLDAVTCEDPLLQEFGMGGLSNICLDPIHHEHILSEPYHIRAIMECLFSDELKYTENTIINSMTLLMLLIDPISQKGNTFFHLD